MGILDKVIEAEASKKGDLITYKQGWHDGHAEGYEKGFAEGFAKAKKQYRSKDFYEPLGEDA